MWLGHWGRALIQSRPLGTPISGSSSSNNGDFGTSQARLPQVSRAWFFKPNRPDTRLKIQHRAATRETAPNANAVKLVTYQIQGLITAFAFVFAPDAFAQAKHMVIVGCDGMSPDGVLKAKSPVMRRLMKEGAWSLHARGVMPTSSSPNWASMIMGAGPEQHGVTSNDWETNKFDITPVAVGSGGIFPTIFGLIREQKPKAFIACVHDWDGFGRLIEPRVPDLLENVKGSSATAARAIEVIHQHKPTFLFIHFDDVDHAGHKLGWKSVEYFQAVEEIDTLIGKVLAALNEAGIRQQTIVIMTADHGGAGTSHGGATMAELEIPLILNGPGIAGSHE